MEAVTFLEWLSSSGAVALIGTIIAGVAVTLFVILSFRRTISIETKDHESKLKEELQPDIVDNLSNLLIQNFRILNKYYTENLRQARMSTMASVSIAVIGFVVIIVGILISFVAKQELLGTISSSAGIIAEIAAALFFKQNRVYLNQMQDSLGKLVSTQYLMTSIALTKKMDEPSKIDEIRAINKHLRTLMDSFHGIKYAA